MAFPVGPANGALTTINGTVYVYNSTKGAWLKQNVGAVTVTNDLTINGTLTENGNLSVSGSLIPSSSMSHRNFVINGGMDVWQRGTSGFTTHNTYTADRWWFVNDSVGASSVSQVDISALGIGTQYALRAERTSGTNRWVVGTQLETIAVKRMLGQTVTFSCKLRKGAALTSNINVTVATSSTEARFGSPVDWTGSDLVVTNASLNTSTFTTFTITFPVPTSSAALGFKIEVSANQTGATNAYFDVTDVQLEIGTKATPFERRHYGFELSLCQRYFQTFGGNYTYEYIGDGVAASTTVAYCGISLVVPMRTAPSVALTSSANNFTLDAGNNNFPITSSIVINSGTSTQKARVTVSYSAGTITATQYYTLLTSNTSTGKIQFSAEL
jgi:hypothetical protein